jgi:hypothetical protein
MFIQAEYVSSAAACLTGHVLSCQLASPRARKMHREMDMRFWLEKAEAVVADWGDRLAANPRPLI